jgi:hypothetical protein
MLMTSSRRHFLKAASLAGLAFSTRAAERPPPVNKATLDRVLEAPVLRTEFLKEPVTVSAIELLRRSDVYLLRVRSKEGAQAITVPNPERMAELAGLSVVPHMSGGGLGYVDVVQFASFTPNIGPFMEFKGNTQLPVECATSSLRCERGAVICPAGPGFGVRVDPDFVSQAKLVTAA